MNVDLNVDLYERIKSGDLIVRLKGPAILRFWKSVDKNGPIHPVCGQCWNWKNVSPNSRHYGKLSINNKPIVASRFSYEIHFGKIPKGLLVCHKCDNRACTNPDHLFLGTVADNHADRDDKERQARGEKQGSTKLTKEEVRSIRKKYKYRSKRFGLYGLAEEFGVCTRQIFKILNRISWKHV